jgi:signal peptidase I
MKVNLPTGRQRAYTGSGGTTRRATFAAAASVLVGSALAGCSAAGKTVGGGTLVHQLTVDSDSMDPTIAKGAVITVDGVTPGSYKPRRQDIVVIHPTAEYQGMQPTDLLVRRVIAIPGDTVSCAGIGSPLMLNGVALKEPYLYRGDAPSMIAFDVKIAANCLWLLGDHRSIALDCRYHLKDPDHGAIPLSNVVGVYHP